MRLVLLILLIFCSALKIQAQLFSKEKLINNQNFDKAKLSYGYYLGFNSYDFNIDYNSNVKDIQVIKSIGFNVGLIGNVRINDFFDVRFEPGLVMSNRNLSFSESYFNGQLFDQNDLERELRSTYIHLPILLKISTKCVLEKNNE